MPEHTVVETIWHSTRVCELIVQRQGLAFEVGDCVALAGPDGVESRPYSIASGLGEDVLRFLIRPLTDGLVSPYLTARRPGDKVMVSEPFGWFRPGPATGADSFLFIATGTGIAPFLAYSRSFPEMPPAMVLYGVRQLADAVGLDLLRATGTDLRLAVSRETAPGTHQGRVTDLLGELPLLPTPHVYLCGLDSMIDEVGDWLESRGVELPFIHREVFFHAEPQPV